MFGFIFGIVVGACGILIVQLVRRERHEWMTNSCSRCGQSLDSWPMQGGGPHGYV